MFALSRINCFCFYVIVLSVNLNIIQCTINQQPKDSIEESFKQCLVSRPAANLGYCLGFGALTKLQSVENDPKFDVIDGLSFTRDEKMYRDGYSVLEDRDPNDYRGILDSVSQVFSRRSMQWDMGFLYPGLAMRVAPSTMPGGQLEFVVDPHYDVVSAHSLKEASTSRILARQFLVPFLMGFKFNIATLIPILFGIIAIIAKKAIFFSKLALVLSSSIALSSLLFPALIGGGGHGGHGGFNPGFGGGHQYGSYHNRYPTEEELLGAGSPHQESPFFRGNEKASASVLATGYGNPEDQLHLYGDIALQGHQQDAFVSGRDDHLEKGRNFAWNDNEKKKKTK